MDPNCPRCDGQGWICELHPAEPFPHGDCPGPGDPCRCNPEQAMPPGTRVICDYRRVTLGQQYARLDELLAKGEDNLTETEWDDFESLAYLFVDPDYRAHRRALIAAGRPKPPCPACHGQGWLCEIHPTEPFPHGNCPGPGDPCACNPEQALPPEFRVHTDRRGTIH